MNNKITIITVTVLALVATGLIAIPSIEQQQAHALTLKDQSHKLKNLIKHAVNKIFNRGSGGSGDGGGCDICG